MPLPAVAPRARWCSHAILICVKVWPMASKPDYNNWLSFLLCDVVFFKPWCNCNLFLYQILSNFTKGCCQVLLISPSHTASSLVFGDVCCHELQQFAAIGMCEVRKGNKDQCCSLPAVKSGGSAVLGAVFPGPRVKDTAWESLPTTTGLHCCPPAIP